MVCRQIGKCSAVRRWIGTIKTGAAEQHSNPVRVNQPGQCGPDKPQDMGIVDVGAQAEAAKFHHLAGKSRKARQIVELCGIALFDLRPTGQDQQSGAAHRPIRSITDKKMLADCVESVRIVGGQATRRTKADVAQRPHIGVFGGGFGQLCGIVTVA